MNAKILLIVAVVVSNLTLYVKGDSLRLNDTVSADGWSHICWYYKAVYIYKLEMPLAHKCDFIRERT